MEKLVMIVLLLLITLPIMAQFQVPAKWKDLIEAISKAESGGNPRAVSPGGTCVGYLQIGAGMVQECNKIAGYKKYTLKDRRSKEKSIEMFLEFQGYHNKKANIEKAIRLWNSGDARCMEPKRKPRTEKYFKKVMKYLEKL
jgi:soluble lytic murein transglycosylase-like protein